MLSLMLKAFKCLRVQLISVAVEYVRITRVPFSAPALLLDCLDWKRSYNDKRGAVAL